MLGGNCPPRALWRRADVSVELIMTYKCLDTVFEFWRLDLKGMGLAERERKVDYVVMPPLGQPAFPKARESRSASNLLSCARIWP